MQDIDITQIVAALIGLLSVLVTSVIVPLIRTKLTNVQWETVKNYALAGVQAAEILFDAQGKGEEKLEWVSSYIESQCKNMESRLIWILFELPLRMPGRTWDWIQSTEQKRRYKMLEWLTKYWLEALFSGILTGLSFIVKMMWNRQNRKTVGKRRLSLEFRHCCVIGWCRRIIITLNVAGSLCTVWRLPRKCTPSIIISAAMVQ